MQKLKADEKKKEDLNYFSNSHRLTIPDTLHQNFGLKI